MSSFDARDAATHKVWDGGRAAVAVPGVPDGLLCAGVGGGSASADNGVGVVLGRAARRSARLASRSGPDADRRASADPACRDTSVERRRASRSWRTDGMELECRDVAVPRFEPHGEAARRSVKSAAPHEPG